MGMPVVIVATGGLPVVVATNGFGVPCTIATNGFGVGVTQATNGAGLAVTGITFGAAALVPFRYWRLVVNNTNQNAAIVAKMELRVVASGADQASGGTPGESGHTGADVAANAFDANAGTWWWSDANLLTQPVSLSYDFGAGVTKDLAQITLQAHNGNASYSPRAFHIQGSNDGSTWTTVWGERNFTAWTPSEVRTFTRPANGLPMYGNPGSIGNRAGTITLIHNIGAGLGTPAMLIDGKNTGADFWWPAAATGRFLTFDFGAGASKVIDGFTWYQDSSAGNGTWTMEGSNDNSSYTTFPESFTLGVPAQQVVTLTNTAGYRYYRLRQTAGTTANTQYIAEIEFKIMDAGAAPAAPTLALTSADTDTTPDFTLTGALVVGDTVRFQYSTSSGFVGASELTNTIDAAEDTANSITFTTGALALGTWYFRARIERPMLVNSGWSNTVTDTIIAPAYTGPGDIVAGAVGWWGLRAYNAAAIGTAAIRVKRADAVEKDILIAANGIINTADAHFNGSTPYQIVKFYDQTGNSKHTDVAVVAGVYPVLDLNDNGSLPTCRHIGTLETTSTIADLAQPTSIVSVARRTSFTSAATQIMQIGTAPHTLEFGLSSNQVQLTIGAGAPTAAATENVTHALGAVFNNTASKLGVDGTTTGSLNIGGSNSSGTGAGRFPGYGYQNNAKIWEGGFWPGDISASFAALSTNAHTVWNF